MKKIVIIMSVLGLLIGYGTSAFTEVRSLHVEWGYTPPSKPAVTGYELYRIVKGTTEIVDTVQINGGDVSEYDFTVNLSPGTNTFVLAARFSDGTLSPWSSPYDFYQPGESCVEPIAVTSDINGVDMSFGTCEGATGYRITIKNSNGVIITTFDTTSDEAFDNILPNGNYTVEIRVIYYGVVLNEVYSTSFVSNVAPANPLKPEVAIETSGKTDAAQTVVVTATAGSDADQLSYTFYSVAPNNTTTLLGTFTAPTGAGNMVKTFNLTGKRGVMVKVSANKISTGLKSELVTVSKQLADINNDGKADVTADKARWIAQNNKTCAAWNFATRNLRTSPLTDCEKADYDHNGVVNTTEFAFLTAHMIAPQSTTVIITN